MPHMTLFEESFEMLTQAQEQNEAGEFREARGLALNAGRAAVRDYVIGSGDPIDKAIPGPGQSTELLASQLKAMGFPIEIVAVCEGLEQEAPGAPKKLLPARPAGDIAMERIRQAKSLTKFLQAALDQPPDPSGPKGDIR